MLDKKKVNERIDAQMLCLTAMADTIFDHPEIAGEEKFAQEFLTGELEKRGFTVVRGIGGMETSFRAEKTVGTGGPVIGYLGEYDALPGIGHACGHHMQTPAAIGAAVAVAEEAELTETPVTVVVYGTPAEESIGGKTVMQRNGCFRELDIAFATHAGKANPRVMGYNYAMKNFRVTWHGASAHAARPENGRSAMDGMLLTFSALEFMREHMKDGARIHYSVAEAMGPCNVVPARAVASIGLRYTEEDYLFKMCERFKRIIEGSCMMTDTTVEIEETAYYPSNNPSILLNDLGIANFKEIGYDLKGASYYGRKGGGSTDFGCVSQTVPATYYCPPFCDAPGHSETYRDAGKTPAARECLNASAKLLAMVTCDLLNDPSLIERAKKEFRESGKCLI